MKRAAPLLLALLLAPAPALAQEAAPDQALARGDEALARGATREAIEIFEQFADRGGLHPDVSYSRGVAYLTRARDSSERPGDLGKAAAGFEEALLLRPEDEGASAALEAVRSEIARRRARKGTSMEVAVSPGALRALSSLLPENGWALGALGASLSLALGLALRRSSGPLRLASGVALGLGGLLLALCSPMTAYARFLRLEVGVGVVVVDEARLVDERGIPTPGKTIPEGARVDVSERRGALLRVKWGEVSGFTQALGVRLLGPRRP